MTVDTRIYCTVEECIHHTPEDTCLCDVIHIKNTFYADASAACSDFEEDEQGE